jgi:hypothetical protein
MCLLNASWRSPDQMGRAWMVRPLLVLAQTLLWLSRFVGLGSKAEKLNASNVFRFATKNRHRATASACPFRANNGSRGPYSITSSARARIIGGIVIRNDLVRV